MNDQFNAWVYILRCSDGSYYVGSHRGENVLRRVTEHQAGLGGYTSTRLPVELVWSESFYWITDAITFERRLKGWSRAKKEALINRDYAALPELAKRPSARMGSSTHPPHPEAPAQRASKDAQRKQTS